MRQLFLHCGPPKTGTSAFQSVLRETPPEGLVYPCTGQWPDGAHHLLVFALDGLKNRGEVVIPAWEDLAGKLAHEMDATDGDVLLSSEALRPVSVVRLLDELAVVLSRPFDLVSVLIVLRHPLERVASDYNQNVKDPLVAESRLPDDFLREAGPGRCLMSLIRTWQSIDLAVTFLSYHPAQTLVARLCDATGHPSHDSTGPIRNRSMAGYGMLAILASHRAQLKDAERAQIFERLVSDRSEKLWEGPSFPFSESACREFLRDSVAPDLAEACDVLGIDLTRLHADPPRRFELTHAQAALVRRHFYDATTDPRQRAVLDHLLKEFGNAG